MRLDLDETSVTILESGVYSVNYNDRLGPIAITVNDSLEDLVMGLSEDKLLGFNNSSDPSYGNSLTATAYLNAGDIVRARPHGIPNDNGGYLAWVFLRVTKLD